MEAKRRANNNLTQSFSRGTRRLGFGLETLASAAMSAGWGCTRTWEAVEHPLAFGKNAKYYEQTQHVAENKQSHFWEPSMLMKTRRLLVITQHVADK
jgi:hypothetical protein